MFDCGIRPGHSGIASLPYLDEEDLSTVDAALITHFHLDHCAAVPYLIGRTTFKVLRVWGIERPGRWVPGARRARGAGARRSSLKPRP
jgi:glyoxylase-like metal-dependent hydrolase (beta-lactamase superfamily II)